MKPIAGGDVTFCAQMHYREVTRAKPARYPMARWAVLVALEVLVIVAAFHFGARWLGVHFFRGTVAAIAVAVIIVPALATMWMIERRERSG